MTLNEYQEKAMSTCMDSCNNWSYMFLNLVGEVGEFASKVAKAIRKKDATILLDGLMTSLKGEDFDSLDEALMKEAGDILWQLSGLCKVMGWELEQIARQNIQKLADRKARGVINGEGDNR